MKVIYKQELDYRSGTGFSISFPKDANVISCGFQGERLVVWFTTDTDITDTLPSHFYLIRTGEELPNDLNLYKFIGTERSYPIASADGKTSMILVDDSWIIVNTLEFHTSFDWLKYAVDKFLSTPSEIFNYNAVAMTQLRQCKSALSGLSIASTHGNIYNTLLAGIKWYNQNKQS